MLVCTTPNCGVCEVLARAAQMAPKKVTRKYVLDVEEDMWDKTDESWEVWDYDEQWDYTDEDLEEDWDYDGQAWHQDEEDVFEKILQLQEAWNSRYHSR